MLGIKLVDGGFSTGVERYHPDARRFADWLCHELMPAIDPFGLRGPLGQGEYEWPESAAAFEAMVAAAVNPVRPVQ